MTTDAETIARYLLHVAAYDREPVPLTQMHLHKLLYFVQGWNFALRGEPLIQEDFRALPRGPVITSLAPHFKKFGSDAIPTDEARDGTTLDVNTRRLVKDVWRRYRKYSANGLSTISHRQAPWREAIAENQPGSPSAVITKQAIERCFVAEFNERCAKQGIDPNRLRRSLAQAERGELTDFEQMVDKEQQA
jgi:uncharacterized phage-associated protein